MPNLTSVGITSGIPSSGTGTVSTIDAMFTGAGTPSASNVVTVQPSSTTTYPLTVTLSSNPTIASLTSGTVAVSSVAGGTIAVSSITGGTITTIGSVTSLTSGTVVVSSLTGGTLTSLTSGTVVISNGGTAAAVKAASTAPSSTDPALVVAISPNGLNPNGSAPSSAAAPVVISSNQQTLVFAQDTTQIGNGVSGTTATPVFAQITASSSGNTTIVSSAAGGGKKIRVLSMALTANGTAAVQWQNSISSNVIAGPFFETVNSGYVLPFSPLGWFQTNSSEALNINLSAASTVGGCLQYITI